MFGNHIRVCLPFHSVSVVLTFFSLHFFFIFAIVAFSGDTKANAFAKLQTQTNFLLSKSKAKEILCGMPTIQLKRNFRCERLSVGEVLDCNH